MVLQVSAVSREVIVFYRHQELERFPLKGLYGRAMSMAEYREAIIAEAKAEQRGWRPLAGGGVGAEEPPVAQVAVAPAPPDGTGLKQEGGPIPV